MMCNVYDNWGRLVGAVIRREQLWKMFHDQSPSTSSASSDISSSSYHQRALQGDNNSQIKEESVIERLPYLVCFDGLDPAFDPSPEDSRNRKTAIDSTQESPSKQLLKSSIEISRKSGELLKDGYVIALHPRDHPAIHVSKQRVKGGGWFLDTMSNVTKRDPAAQFLVVFRNKDTIGLRSFTAGGKLLQINRRMEFFFASHSFDVWESWIFEGSLEECRLVNCRNPLAVLEVYVEIVAAVGGDGITRWLD